GEVRLAHLGCHGEYDVPFVRHARYEVHDRTEWLILDVGGEPGRDPDRDLAADLEHRVLAAHRHDPRLCEQRRQPLALEELDEDGDVVFRQPERVGGTRQTCGAYGRYIGERSPGEPAAHEVYRREGVGHVGEVDPVLFHGGPVELGDGDLEHDLLEAEVGDEEGMDVGRRAPVPDDE